MNQEALASGDAGGFLAVYDAALPHVYGYLSARCGRGPLAEDLTAETFLAGVDAVRAGRAPALSVPWFIGVARHKLVDHWRRTAREERNVRAVGVTLEESDGWEADLDALRAHQVLSELSPVHRAVLTLRYLDDLTVPAVAEIVERSVHATEGLLARARSSFRRAYDDEVTDA